MRKRKVDIIFSSRRLIAILAVVLLFAGLTFLAEGFVDTASIRAQITQLVKDKTGKDLTIKGKITVSMLPMPTVYVPGVELRDENTESPGPSISIDMVKINLSVFSMFSSAPQITGVRMESPSLDIERGHDGVVHWDWLTSSLLTAGGDNSLSVTVEDGKLLYHNNLTDRIVAFDGIDLSGKLGRQLDVGGSFEAFGHIVQVALAKDNAAPAAGSALPILFKLYSGGKNMLQWQGTADTAADGTALKGKLTLESENILPWLHPESTVKHESFDVITNDAQEKVQDTSVYPVKLSADWDGQGLDVSLSNLVLQGFNSAATGKMALTWDNATPMIDLGMDFSALDYNHWREAADKLADYYKDAAPQTPGYHSNDEPQENPLPKDVQMTLNLTAQQLYIGAQTWQHAQTLIKLADASLTVDQFNVELPGEATLSLFGVVTEGSGAGAKGLRFEGSMETKGKSLRQMLTVFDESAKELPDTGFGQFFARSNIFVSPEQVRLSEADVQISDLHLNGGLVAYFDTNPRIEADVRLKDINFDYFRDVWRKGQTDAGKQDFFLKFDKSQNFNWLKKLQTTIDFRVNVDRFTFLDRKGTGASFRLFARENEFGIYDIHLAYPGDMTEANLKLDVSSGTPSVSVVLNTSELNTNYFSVGEKDTPPPADNPVPAADAAKPADVAKPADAAPAAAPNAGDAKAVKIVPQAAKLIELAQDDTQTAVLPQPAQSVEDLPHEAPKPNAAQPVVEKKEWPHDLIDMSWMDGINGSFDISVGKLTYGDHVFSDFKMRSRLDTSMLTFQSLSFFYWQGKCDIAGSLYGGTVPGLSISYTLYDNDLHDILKSLVGWDNIGGRVSISGTLATSGVNYLSWLSQADAKLVVAGRGVLVNGVNLQGAVDAVQVSRTAADVLNNVNLALLSGSTEFNVDGNLNVKSGVIRTPGITLKTGNITGNLNGEVNLVPWTMQLAVLFQFPDMTSETVPTMAMQLAGPIPHPQLQTDTSSLEAYVAKRIVGH